LILGASLCAEFENAAMNLAKLANPKPPDQPRSGNPSGDEILPAHDAELPCCQLNYSSLANTRHPRRPSHP